MAFLTVHISIIKQETSTGIHPECTILTGHLPFVYTELTLLCAHVHLEVKTLQLPSASKCSALSAKENRSTQ
jgi:hypothetical protein